MGKKASALKTEVMGVLLDNQTQESFLERARQLLSQGQGGLIVTVNAQMLHLARKSPAFREFLNSAQLSIPDGQGALYAARMLHGLALTKCAGVEFGDKLCRVLVQEGKSLYILGGASQTPDRAAWNLQQKYPGLRIAGTHHGYFSDGEAVAKEIAALEPDCLYVCLGCPKQEEFIVRYRHLFPRALILPLGGSVDIYAGTLRRAPKWMIDLGLEWLFRLVQQPKRWKQMLFLPQFVLEVWKEKRKNHG